MRIQNAFAVLLALCLVLAALPVSVSAQSADPPAGITLESKLAVYAGYRAMLNEIIENTEILNEISLRKGYVSHWHEWTELRADPKGDRIGLAVEMVDTFMEELSDYYTGNTGAMPLEIAKNSLYQTLPLREAIVVMGDPIVAERDLSSAGTNSAAAIADAREAVRTGDPATAQRALSEYADALEAAAHYLKSSGLENVLDSMNSPTPEEDEVGGYLAYFRDPGEYENYNEERLSTASDALMEAFFSYTLLAGYQMIADCRDYLAARPALTDEESDLLARVNAYSFVSLAEADTVIREELFPFFFGWYPSGKTETAAFTLPGVPWRIEGTADEIRTNKYAELRSRVLSLADAFDALFATMDGKEEFYPDYLAKPQFFVDETANLLADLDATAGAVSAQPIHRDTPCHMPGATCLWCR
ncbi:MAG: hypothetical protein IKS35_01860 [Clostridia bacterium]|nr:hypothetical protein [Clostridia bacterium]